MTCARRASRTAPCATRRFTAVTWTGACCDEAAIIVVLDAAATLDCGGARHANAREGHDVSGSFDRILAHRIDRFGLSLENGRCRMSRYLSQHRESGLRA